MKSRAALREWTMPCSMYTPEVRRNRYLNESVQIAMKTLVYTKSRAYRPDNSHLYGCVTVLVLPKEYNGFGLTKYGLGTLITCTEYPSVSLSRVPCVIACLRVRLMSDV